MSIDLNNKLNITSLNIKKTMNQSLTVMKAGFELPDLSVFNNVLRQQQKLSELTETYRKAGVFEGWNIAAGIANQNQIIAKAGIFENLNIAAGIANQNASFQSWNIAAGIASSIETQNEAIFSKLQSLYAGFGLNLDKIKNELLVIARNGWFVDFATYMSFRSEVFDEFEKGNTQGATEMLVQYYSDSLENIFVKVIKRYPTRELIFEQLLDAYKKEKYYLFIPTLLSQVDGICNEVTAEALFIKDRKKYLPKVSEVLNSGKSGSDIYLSPLLNSEIPIYIYESKCQDFPCQLNRHKILHGKDTSYGTKINSLKVISLLSYISDLLAK